MLSDAIRKYVKERLAIVSDDNISETVLGNGRSGSEVYRLKIQSRKPRLTGYYILKICDIEENEDDLESYKARLFYEYDKEFSKHLVKIVDDKKLNGKSIIIYSQASNTVINSVPFLELDGEHMAKYARCVSGGLLSLLNREEMLVPAVPTDFFNTLIGKQLSDNGRFVQRMEYLLNKPEAECIVLNGVVYPNPLYLVRNDNRLEKCLSECLFQKGAVHGDLHGYNLLIADDAYTIIDYDSSSIDSYLLYDHAYLEFSIFYDKSKNNDLKEWELLLKRLIAPSLYEDAIPCENFLEFLVRNAVCGGIRDWMKLEELEKRRDDIEIQFLMARIAAGVNFFCKKTCADVGKQLKVLLYISYCLKILFNKIGCQYDENDITGLYASLECDDSDELWEDFVKYTNYIPVLVTDDRYSATDFEVLKSLCGIDWAVIIDIGLEQQDSVIFKVFLENCRTRIVKKINIIADEKPDSFNHILNIFSIRKSKEGSYAGEWRKYGKRIINSLKKLISDNPQVPLLFVFDCSKDSSIFQNQVVNNLCDNNLPRGTRFITLGAHFSEDFKAEIVELEELYKWHFIEHVGLNLTHVAQVCKIYLNRDYNLRSDVNLPSLNGIYTFKEKDLISFETSIELVYAGCENSKDISLLGNDIYDAGNSFGENFYKGSEVTWSDIAFHRDLPLMEKEKYNSMIKELLCLIEEKSPRVKTIELHHGAGTGGTTLSKRILWDMKEKVPCAYLKKFSLQTAEILLEIYQRTGKSVLLAVESGSTVITEEELNFLKKKIDSENGKAVILLIKRISSTNLNSQKKTILHTLKDTMNIEVANNFKKIFSEYAKKKVDASERKKWLNNITGVDKYKEQRSPFFYGFYTFQEEYHLLRSLSRTVSDCVECERQLLNSLALVTIFSQNVCVAFRELPLILKQEYEGELNTYLIREMISPAMHKLIVIRKNGFRLCHRVIAIKILTLLHDTENKHVEWENVVFKATKEYVKIMSEIYDSDNEYVNDIMKELLIDRAYIDSEDRKTKFSVLVESIPRWTDRQNLFEYLIQKFPDNPHYYNHLARLFAIGNKENNIIPQYEKAVEMARKAIEIADIAKNTHETTLGCIYGWWILNDIREQTKNKRRGRLASKYSELISDISVRYGLAKTQFENAREHVDIYDSFSFFPQIKMECDIIVALIGHDLNRNLEQLLRDSERKDNVEEVEFREWYEEHFCIATELYNKMKEYLKEDVSFLREAKYKIQEIAKNSVEEINERFSQLLESDISINRRRSRSLIYRVYALNGFNWGNKNISQESRCFAEKCARRNLMEVDEEHGKYDFDTWFELYRRVEYFRADEAQEIIADYMPDGYRKEYLLFLMTFLMRKNGIASASTEIIIQRIKETKRLASLQGLNTLYSHDVYLKNSQGLIGCPIVSMLDVPRRNHEPTSLEIFTGIVTEVDQTHGTILLDKLNLDVNFVPRPTSLSEDESRMFYRKDVGCEVNLNIMFSYSGLIGWNVIKRETRIE